MVKSLLNAQAGLLSGHLSQEYIRVFRSAAATVHEGLLSAPEPSPAPFLSLFFALTAPEVNMAGSAPRGFPHSWRWDLEWLRLKCQPSLSCCPPRASGADPRLLPLQTPIVRCANTRLTYHELTDPCHIHAQSTRRSSRLLTAASATSRCTRSRHWCARPSAPVRPPGSDMPDV